MRRSSHGAAAAVALGAALLVVGIVASFVQSAKPAVKRTAGDGASRLPAATPMTPGRPGGILNVMLREDLSQGFAVHETATISTVFPASPCFNNLVMFDPATPIESLGSVVPELAEVIAVQKQLEKDSARPTLDIRLDHFTVWPHVKGLVPHHNIFNFGRMQNVWRDRS